MLIIITEDGIFTNPMRVFVHYHGNGHATIWIWPNYPRDIHLSCFPITHEMPEHKAQALYNRIADQVAAGVTVIDLRKMMNEE